MRCCVILKGLISAPLCFGFWVHELHSASFSPTHPSSHFLLPSGARAPPGAAQHLVPTSPGGCWEHQGGQWVAGIMGGGKQTAEGGWEQRQLANHWTQWPQAISDHTTPVINAHPHGPRPSPRRWAATLPRDCKADTPWRPTGSAQGQVVLREKVYAFLQLSIPFPSPPLSCFFC